MAQAGARALGCGLEQVLVASTGVIGVALPIDKVTRGVERAATLLARNQHASVARTIMTTDPFPKNTRFAWTRPGGPQRRRDGQGLRK